MPTFTLNVPQPPTPEPTPVPNRSAPVAILPPAPLEPLALPEPVPPPSSPPSLETVGKNKILPFQDAAARLVECGWPHATVCAMLDAAPSDPTDSPFPYSLLEVGFVRGLVDDNDCEQLAALLQVQQWSFVRKIPAPRPLFHEFPALEEVVTYYRGVIITPMSKKVFTVGHFDPFVLAAFQERFTQQLREYLPYAPFVQGVYVPRHVLTDFYQ